MAIESINPTTEEVIARFDEHTPAQVEVALQKAWHAFGHWRRKGLEERAEALSNTARLLRQDKQRFATIITTEMGKPIVEAEAEIEKCAWCCDYYAANARDFLAPVQRESTASESYIAFEPLGPVLAIMPWNFPFWQVFRFAAPALMAGNVGLLKHSSNVPQCALAIADVLDAAGLPEGTFQTLLLAGSSVESVIGDDRVRAVTLTGSDFAGAKVAEAAGKALKKTVLELGGSDPFIVLADADLVKAVEVGVRARNQNAGQSCIAAKRFIVVEDVAEEFEERLAQAAGRLRLGDPMERETQVGPLARRDLREDLDSQVRRSLEQGARVACGGAAPEGSGYFYAPTVLTNVSREMPAFREETFGPAAAVIRAAHAEEAIVLANESQYGLGASLWTRDVDRARVIARQIEAGSVFVNGMVASDPRLPFGGVKRSGYGRELSEFGIREFVNIQTVWIGPARDEVKPAE
jgi:acyl-CoA reductase-like NAD-dependent aldehyde dehydrogenase